LSEKLTISCDVRCLPKIRKFVEHTLNELDLGEIETHKVVLAVDEICANLIIHANKSDPAKELSVIVEVKNQEVWFTIKDKGVAFDFTSYQEPSLDQIVSEKRKGGLGLMLVKRIMDHIEFTTEKNYNICRLKKKI